MHVKTTEYIEFIKSALGRLNIRKRNSCASALVSLSDVQPLLVYKSHILNGPINKLYIFSCLHKYIWLCAYKRSMSFFDPKLSQYDNFKISDPTGPFVTKFIVEPPGAKGTNIV